MIAPIPVAAVLLVAILPSLRSSTPAQSGQYSEERTKGITTALQIYRQQGGTLEKMANGEPVKPHDLIQLSYSVENRKYGVIVSVDGRKQVTLHWPEKAEVSPLLEPGREVVLPSSFELDESPLFETFVLVTSEKPFSADQIVGAAKAGRMDAGTGRFKIDLPAEGSQGMQQFTITLRK
ncbi:MAG TPA: hypothetical protein DCS07_09280 [Bdellovibrionales bacterium]|nr:hypothetical protein [Bdellovibrionales bacterium]